MTYVALRFPQGKDLRGIPQSNGFFWLWFSWIFKISHWNAYGMVQASAVIRPLPFNHSGNRKIYLMKQFSEFQLPLNHLYQAYSGPGLDQVPVDSSQLSGSRKICISCGTLEDEIGKTKSWRNTNRGVDLKKMRFVPGAFSCTNSPTSCTLRLWISTADSVLVYQNIIFDFVVRDHELLTRVHSLHLTFLSLLAHLPWKASIEGSIEGRARIHRQGVGRVDAICLVRHQIWTSRTCVLSHVVHIVLLSCLALQRARLRSVLFSCNMQENSCNCSVWCWVSPLGTTLQTGPAKGYCAGMKQKTSRRIG